MTSQVPWSTAVCLLCVATQVLQFSEGSKSSGTDRTVLDNDFDNLHSGQNIETWLAKDRNDPEVGFILQHSLDNIIDSEDIAKIANIGPNQGFNKRGWPYALSAYSYLIHHLSPPKYFVAPTRFSRISRGRLSRMPISFGKRQAELAPGLDDFTSSENYNDNVEEDSDEGENELERQDEDLQLFRTARARLQRMPIQFGKRLTRTGYRYLPQPDQESVPLPQREVRGKLNRMPLTFGKRSDPNMASFLHGQDTASDKDEEETGGETIVSDDDLEHGSFERNSRSKLTRMPLAFGKRGGSSLTEGRTVSDNYLDRDVAGKRSRLGRMPLAFGKRGRLSRMPVSFGKRENSLVHDLVLTSLLREGNKNRDLQGTH